MWVGLESRARSPCDNKKMSAPSSSGRFFHDVPENQPLLKTWLTGLGNEDTFSLVLKKYHAHREAHRPDSIWSTIRNTVRPPARNPWRYGSDLLEWGLHQPWASDIKVRDTLKAVATTVTLSPAQHPQVWRTLHTRIPEQYQQTVARAVADTITQASSSLSFEGSKLESLQEWAALYHTAYQKDIPEDAARQWRIMCVQTLQRHMDGKSDSDPEKAQALQEQREWLRNQLADEMLTNPTPIWNSAVRYLHPQTWIQEADTIRALYGTNEAQLAHLLPYMSYTTVETCALHEQLVEKFCPTAYPVLQGLLDPHDWAEPTKITDMIALMGPGALNAPPQAMPLPSLTNSMP